MNFKPTFYEITLPNKDIKIVVAYAYGCECGFKYHYNSVAGTFYGLACDSFVESVRGLLRSFPLFFESIGTDYRNDLTKMGIFKTTAPNRVKRIYETLGS